MDAKVNLALFLTNSGTSQSFKSLLHISISISFSGESVSKKISDSKKYSFPENEVYNKLYFDKDFLLLMNLLEVIRL